LCAPIQPTLDVTIPVAIGPTGGDRSAARPGRDHVPDAAAAACSCFAQFVAVDFAQAAPLSVALSDDIKWRIGALGPYAVTRISATSATTAPPALVSGTLATTYVPVYAPDLLTTNHDSEGPPLPSVISVPLTVNIFAWRTVVIRL
jgi:hypothetical protein